jgi:hypothetical protein
MNLKEAVAYRIYKIRCDLDIPGSPEHDWWLAKEFLYEHGNEWDEDDIYLWFIQLGENLVK